MGSERVRHDWANELNWNKLNSFKTEITKNTHKCSLFPSVDPQDSHTWSSTKYQVHKTHARKHAPVNKSQHKSHNGPNFLFVTDMCPWAPLHICTQVHLISLEWIPQDGIISSNILKLPVCNLTYKTVNVSGVTDKSEPIKNSWYSCQFISSDKS